MDTRSLDKSHAALGLLLFAVMAGAPIGCGGGGGDGGTGPTPDTAASLTGEGWALFTSGNSSGALAKFDAAIAKDASHAEAYVGQGWARLGLASSASAMLNAVASFDAAANLGSAGAEVLAGRAAARLGAGDSSLGQAAADAQAAYQASPAFQFSRRTSFDYRDLHLIEAFARAAQGDLDAALAAANQVIASSIVAGSSATWVVGGTAYDSYQGAVLAFLRQLSDAHAG